MAPRRPYRRVILPWLAIAVCAFYLLMGRGKIPSVPRSISNLQINSLQADNRPPAGWEPSQHSVIIGTRYETHEDVWLYLGGTLRSIGVETEIYGECDDSSKTCIKFGQLELANELGVWNHPLRRKSDFFDSVNKRLPSGRLADIVLLPTEKDDLPWASEPLLQKWKERPSDQKFTLMVIYHGPLIDSKPHLKEWAKTGHISYLCLSTHTQSRLHDTFSQAARMKSYLRYGFEHIPTNVVVPFWDLSDRAPSTKKFSRRPPSEEHIKPSQIVVAGGIDFSKRDYDALTGELQKLLENNPKEWGYRYDEAAEQFLPIDKTDPTTFKLLLVGSKQWGYRPLKIGPMENVIEVISGESQDEFFELMKSTDILLNAWFPDSKFYTSKLSGGTVRSIETGAPLLTTQAVLDQYFFLDDSITILRPEGLTELEAVRLFRKYPDPSRLRLPKLLMDIGDDLPDLHHHKLEEEAAEMVMKGWRRDKEIFRRRREQIQDNSKKELISAIMRAGGGN